MALHKRSKKREAIYECVRATKTHPTAEWVYGQLKPSYPDLSLGTVYRNLAMFRQEGKLVSVGTVDGMERYDANTVPHAHFVCTHCNAVIDVNVPLPEELITSVDCGGVHHCELTFFGVCHSCVRADVQNKH